MRRRPSSSHTRTSRSGWTACGASCRRAHALTHTHKHTHTRNAHTYTRTQTPARAPSSLRGVRRCPRRRGSACTLLHRPWIARGTTCAPWSRRGRQSRSLSSTCAFDRERASGEGEGGRVGEAGTNTARRLCRGTVLDCVKRMQQELAEQNRARQLNPGYLPRNKARETIALPPEAVRYYVTKKVCAPSPLRPAGARTRRSLLCNVRCGRRIIVAAAACAWAGDQRGPPRDARGVGTGVRVVRAGVREYCVYCVLARWVRARVARMLCVYVPARALHVLGGGARVRTRARPRRAGS